jgi:hypothetical protein
MDIYVPSAVKGLDSFQIVILQESIFILFFMICF